jgi:transposase
LIAGTLDVVATVDRHVPKRGHRGPSVGQYLLLAALNRCVAPRSKSQIGSWYKKSVLARLLPLTANQLTSQRFWDNMEQLSSDQIPTIEQELAHNAVTRFGLDLNCLLFDATNFFAFLDSFNNRAKLPERGHAKQGHDNLRLLGLAVLATTDGDVPLLHHTYAGNQHDSVMFHSVVDQLFARCRALCADVTLLKRLCQFGVVVNGGGFAASLDEFFKAWGNLFPDVVRCKSRRQCETNPT